MCLREDPPANNMPPLIITVMTISQSMESAKTTSLVVLSLICLFISIITGDCYYVSPFSQFWEKIKSRRKNKSFNLQIESLRTKDTQQLRQSRLYPPSIIYQASLQ